MKDIVFLQKFKPEQFPRLEIVHLSHYSESYDYFSSGIFPKVTTLRLDAYQEAVITELWNRNFPNLKKVELLDAMPKHLEFVFSHLNYIRNFTVVFSLEKTEDTEIARILTGAPLVISDELELETETALNKIDDSKHLSRLPSLSNMKCK